MGAITYGFDSVPTMPSAADASEIRDVRAQYALILRSAATAAAAVPLVEAPITPVASKASREEVVLYLQRLAGALIRFEVETDRDLFAGLTDQQIAQVLRRLQIPNLPCGPNLLSPEDVAAALTD